jgi:hypothetical protein
MSKPIIENSLWQKAFALNSEMKEAIINPNTDFMTKLLFDARFFQKNFGKELAYWSNLIFSIKFLMMENGSLDITSISKIGGFEERDVVEVVKYLVHMGELIEEKGQYKLAMSNPFSRIFKKI